MIAKPMLSRSWWMLALRGVLALLFGVLALLLPGPTVLSLVLLFAAYALLAGIVYLGTPAEPPLERVRPDVAGLITRA